MQLHPSRFHSSEPLWVDRLAVLAVGDQKAASRQARPDNTQGPDFSAGTVVRG